MQQPAAIRAFLNELNIYSFSEYMTFVNEWESFNNRVFKGGQKKIDALRNVVVDYYYNFANNQRLEGQYISIDTHFYRDPLYRELLTGKALQNYMCIFPKRTLIETSTLYTYTDIVPHDGEEYDMPPNDFFLKFFLHEKLLDKGIAHLYPVKSDLVGRCGSTSVMDSSMIVPIKNVADVSQSGTFSTVVQQSNIFYLAFPWLYNANTDVFLDICDKYPAEFENLAIAIEKIAIASNNNGTDLHDSVVKELKEALINIQIAFDKKKNSLKAKGIATTLGIALTCVPFAVPDFFSQFNPEIFKTVMGSSSILGSKYLLSNFLELGKECNENPFWVLWKWKHATM